MQCLVIDKNGKEGARIAGLLQGLGFDCEAQTDLGMLDLAPHHKPKIVFAEASSIGQAERFFRDLRAGRKGAPKVICYGNSPRVDDAASYIMAGAEDVLVQPFDPELLRFKLQQAGLLPR